MGADATPQNVTGRRSVIVGAVATVVAHDGTEPDDVFEELSMQARLQGLTMLELATAMLNGRRVHAGDDRQLERRVVASSAA